MLSGDPSLHMFSCSLILEGRMTVTMGANLSHARVANCEISNRIAQSQSKYNSSKGDFA